MGSVGLAENKNSFLMCEQSVLVSGASESLQFIVRRSCIREPWQGGPKLLQVLHSTAAVSTSPPGGTNIEECLSHPENTQNNLRLHECHVGAFVKKGGWDDQTARSVQTESLG